MILRPAYLADAATLAAFGGQSFTAAFGHLYSASDLAAFIEEVYSPASVAEEIAGDDCIHQLAMDGEALAGYCKMRRPSKLAAHSDASNPIELGQLYTAPGRTGQGIGAALMDWAIDVARAGGHDAILLSVWSGNTGAQRFYERYGFAKIADIHFKVGEQLDEEFLFEMKM
ncbi:GNAT family N-acetyltransferase [Qipengyuania zhejiangensis]|uniref:GNAT family N-acetyltransferase n=1 Tax=Qipengyuania zhejiangensis TaxID=3077782 RepID=UPI002D77390F|nr:GNAT family N-acetyltransferase [Qipengyuania sp. Z2]